MNRAGKWALGVVWLAGLAAYPLLESTEARYASVAWHMAHAGSWLEPIFNGLPLFSKPPLAYWLGAVALRILPDAAWAVRLPATLGLLAAVWLSWRLARVLEGESRATAVVPLLAAFSPLAVVQGHMTTGDIFLWVGVVAAYVALCDDTLGATRRAVLLGLGLALGFMAKGHMVLFWVVLPPTGWAVIAPAQRRRLRWLLHPTTLLVFAVLVVPWFTIVIGRHPELVDFWLGQETKARLLSTAHGRAEPWWYFLPQVPLLMLPWLPELWRGLRARQRSLLPLVWVVLPLVVFTLSGSKRPNYLLPMVTPLALITARGWPSQPRLWLKWRTGGWLAVALLWPFVLGLGHWGPPTGALVSQARRQGHALMAYHTAPSGLVFYHHGPVPVYGLHRGGIGVQGPPPPPDDPARLRRHLARGGWVFLHRHDLPALENELKQGVVVEGEWGGYVVVGGLAVTPPRPRPDTPPPGS